MSTIRTPRLMISGRARPLIMYGASARARARSDGRGPTSPSPTAVTRTFKYTSLTDHRYRLGLSCSDRAIGPTSPTYGPQPPRRPNASDSAATPRAVFMAVGAGVRIGDDQRLIPRDGAGSRVASRRPSRRRISGRIARRDGPRGVRPGRVRPRLLKGVHLHAATVRVDRRRLRPALGVRARLRGSGRVGVASLRVASLGRVAPGRGVIGHIVGCSIRVTSLGVTRLGVAALVGVGVPSLRQERLLPAPPNAVDDRDGNRNDQDEEGQNAQDSAAAARCGAGACEGPGGTRGEP